MDADLKQLLDTKFEGIDTSLHNSREIMNLKFETIIDHNERQNGWIQAHTESIEKLEDHARSCKSQRKMIRKISKRWWLAIVAVVFICCGTVWGYHHLDISKVKVGPVELEFKPEPVRGGEVH